jgi:hypothetical protein
MDFAIAIATLLKHPSSQFRNAVVMDRYNRNQRRRQLPPEPTTAKVATRTDDGDIMPSLTPQPEKLLYYIAAKKVLICKECHYAIQPSAISGHLKVLHHIYRSDRQEFMKYAQSLDLANPKDVVLPETHEAPIPFLPTEDGLSCGVTRCDHLCASVKRMKTHWATVHRDIVAGPHVPQWRPVKLQTFFRGNQLRYFVVSESSILVSQPQMEPEVHSKCLSLETGPPLTDDSN